MNEPEIQGTVQERRLYELIWKRTLASQMADAVIEKTTVTIDIDGQEEHFVANGEVISFDGFIKAYRESIDDDNDGDDVANMLPSMKKGDVLKSKEIVSTERFSQSPIRYTEASLVKKMEELGIGRPSTYAPTISTIQQREYVQKGDKKGEERQYVVDTLKGSKISSKQKKEVFGNEKGKLIPTDTGIVVNDFLMENFKDIMEFDFTAKVEAEFDKIAAGKKEWSKMMKSFDKEFEPQVDKVMNSRQEHKAGEREIGIDPKSGKPVFVKIGRFGPVVQIGSADDAEKPRFAQMPKDKTMDSLTLEEALELFRLPRELDEYEGEKIVIGMGRFGAYVLYNKQYVSLPKDADPLTITLDEAIVLIEEKKSQEQQRHIKTFEEDAMMEVLNGRYGPYISYDGQNYRLPKQFHARAAELTYEECKRIVDETPVRPTAKVKRGRK